MKKVSFGELLGLLDLIIKAYPELVIEPDLETVKLAESLVNGITEKASQQPVEADANYCNCSKPKIYTMDGHWHCFNCRQGARLS